MPDDSDERLAAIRRDLPYFLGLRDGSTVGPPPTVHAAKYADDVEFLLSLLPAPVPAPVEKTQLEIALEHDAAGRTERRSRTP